MTMDRIIRCRYHNPVLSPFITCQLTFEKSNTKGVSNRVFSGVRVSWSLLFMCMFCRSLFVPFLLVIVLSVLRFTNFDYPFGIFKLFFTSGVNGIRVAQSLVFCVVFCKLIFKELSNHIIKRTPFICSILLRGSF